MNGKADFMNDYSDEEINMIENKVVHALLEECIKVFEELRKSFQADGINYRTFPVVAVVVYKKGKITKFGRCYKKGKTEGVWRIEDGKYTVQPLSDMAVHEPISNVFFKEGDFDICFDLDKKEAYLSYQFGPRFGRGLSYELVVDDLKENIECKNPKVIWVS